MSTRPSFFRSQRFIAFGLVIGLLLGCALGSGAGLYYAWQMAPVSYQGGAYPSELTQAYQNHYLAMVVDSYLVNQQLDIAIERLKTFDTATQVRMLAERSASYVSAGRGVEAQLINTLALELRNRGNWDEATIQNVIADLTVEYQADPARAQAISSFSAQLLNGRIPVPAPTEPTAGPEPAIPSGEVPAPAQEGPLVPTWAVLLCCLGLLVVFLGLAYWAYLSRKRSQAPGRRPVVWEGEGRPPLKQWTGTYTFGQDNYDEFFTIETDDGDFLGESGIGIMDSVPGTSPKQVLSFDVGLFDKTDITTLSRVVMSPYAYKDEPVRNKVEANPQADAILAQPGKKFSFETTAMRVEAEILDVEFDAEQKYFEKLTSKLNVFLKEGADIRRGEMDIPDQFR
jgi:hypothetical protein